jgi:hypothetical protein
MSNYWLWQELIPPIYLLFFFSPLKKTILERWETRNSELTPNLLWLIYYRPLFPLAELDITKITNQTATTNNCAYKVLIGISLVKQLCHAMVSWCHLHQVYFWSEIMHILSMQKRLGHIPLKQWQLSVSRGAVCACIKDKGHLVTYTRCIVTTWRWSITESVSKGIWRRLFK